MHFSDAKIKALFRQSDRRDMDRPLRLVRHSEITGVLCFCRRQVNICFSGIDLICRQSLKVFCCKQICPFLFICRFQAERFDQTRASFCPEFNDDIGIADAVRV